MKLNLKRPIVFFDLETTGVDTARDRIVEISMIKVMPDGEEITRTRRLNPGMHIPAEATAVHGITDDDVKECPTFAQVAKSLEQFIRGCDFGGFNSNRFDLPVLVEEFLRAGVDVDLKKRKFIDVQNIFHKKEQRTLVAAYKFYCDKDLDDAHSAEADTRATYEVLKAQLDRYPDLENDVAALADFSARGEAADYAGRILYNDKGEEVFGFGKYKGRSVAEIFRLEPSYYAWCSRRSWTAIPTWRTTWPPWPTSRPAAKRPTTRGASSTTTRARRSSDSASTRDVRWPRSSVSNRVTTHG